MNRHACCHGHHNARIRYRTNVYQEIRSIYDLFLNYKNDENSLIYALNNMGDHIAYKVKEDIYIADFIATNGKNFSDNLVEVAYKALLFDEPKTSDYSFEIFAHLLESKNLTEKTLLKIYKNEGFDPLKAKVLVNPKITWEFFEQEFDSVFNREFLTNRFVSAAKHPEIWANVDTYDIDKFSYIAKNSRFADDMFSKIFAYGREVPERIIESLKQNDSHTVQDTILSNKANSKENCKRDIFNHWDQTTYFSILKNPNVPEYILKHKIDNFDYDNQNLYNEFFTAMFSGKSVSEKVIVLHSQAIIESKALEQIDNAILAPGLKNIPFFLSIVWLIDSLKNNDYKPVVNEILANTCLNNGINVHSFASVVRKTETGEFVYTGRLNKTEKMVLALKDGLDNEIELKIANSWEKEVRQLLAFSQFTSSFILRKLSNDSNVLVRLLVALNKNTDQETLRKMLENETDSNVRENLYLNIDLTAEEIESDFEKAYETNDLTVLRLLAKHKSAPWKIVSELLEFDDDEVKFNALSNEITPELYAHLM